MFFNASCLSANFMSDSYFNTSHYTSFDFKRKIVPDECEKPLKSFDLDYVNNTRCMLQCHFYSLRCIIIITAMERTKWERIRKHLKKSRKRTFRAWWKQFLFIFYIVYFLLNNCFLIVHFSLFSNNLQPAKTTK